MIRDGQPAYILDGQDSNPSDLDPLDFGRPRIVTPISYQLTSSSVAIALIDELCTAFPVFRRGRESAREPARDWARGRGVAEY